MCFDFEAVVREIYLNVFSGLSYTHTSREDTEDNLEISRRVGSNCFNAFP